jgi:hypothetical protein
MPNGEWKISGVLRTYLPFSICHFWPDPGLTRNTRRRCYRCSVPGLAEFTRLALCGARDLITFQNWDLGFEPLAFGLRPLVLDLRVRPKTKDQRPKAEGQRPKAEVFQTSVLRCATNLSSPLIARCSMTYATNATTIGKSKV